MTLRELRFNSDFFIQVDDQGQIIVTNRRNMNQFYDRLREELTALGLQVSSISFKPCEENWP